MPLTPEEEYQLQFLLNKQSSEQPAIQQSAEQQAAAQPDAHPADLPVHKNAFMQGVKNFIGGAGKVVGMATGVAPMINAYDKMKANTMNGMAGMSPEDMLALQQYGSEFFGQAGTQGQQSAWNMMSPRLRAALVKNLGTMRTKRQAAYSLRGYDDVGNPVFVNVAEPGLRDEEGHTIPPMGRLIPTQRPQMSEGQINDVTNLLNAKQQLDGVKTLFSPDATGPLEARIYDFSVATGIDFGKLKGLSSITNDKVKMTTLLSSAVNDYIKAVTGAQMSEPEARRIMQAMPKRGAADEAFIPVLNEVVRITEQKLDTRLKVLESQGTVGVEKIRKMSGSSQSAPKRVQSSLEQSAPKIHTYPSGKKVMWDGKEWVPYNG